MRVQSESAKAPQRLLPGFHGPALAVCLLRFGFRSFAFAVRLSPFSRRRFTAAASPPPFGRTGFGLAAPKSRQPRGPQGAFPAPGLIAAKPGKPCDGGVFGAFYLLLKKERCACDPKAPKSRKPAPATALTLENQRHAFHTPSQALTWPPPGLCRLSAAQPFCSPTFTAQLLGLTSARLPQSRTAAGCETLWGASSCAFPAFFRSLFDSSQARKTVRWRRFGDLLFAPEKRAMRTCSVCPVFVLSAPFTPRPGFDLTAARPSWPDCTGWLWRCVAVAEKPHGGRLRDALGRFFLRLLYVFSLLIR